MSPRTGLRPKRVVWPQPGHRGPAHGPVLLLLGLGLLLLAAGAASSGAMDIPFRQLPALLAGTPQALDAEQALWREVLLQVRLPRVLLAVITGAGLAVSGAAMQALFRNPLAEPGLIGVSSGGALGAVAAIVLGAASLVAIGSAAFAGSLLATLAAYRLGRQGAGVAGVLLAGIAINALCGAVIGLLTWQANDVQLRSLTFWSLGSLAAANWTLMAWLGPWALMLTAWLLRDWRTLNALLLGEREAVHLGFALVPLRRRLIVKVALLVGPLVAVTGTIGFVGLVVPHLVRLALGADHRLLLPASVLGGAMALTVADWLARVLAIPAELPIGILTSLVGGPFLLWLLSRRP